MSNTIMIVESAWLCVEETVLCLKEKKEEDSQIFYIHIIAL